MDFDATKEIWRFFSQYELSTASLNNQKTIEVNFWPNPVSSGIHIQSANDELITEISIIDLRGRLIEKKTGENLQFIDLDKLEAGNYLLKISGDDFIVSKKLIVQNY